MPSESNSDLEHAHKHLAAKLNGVAAHLQEYGWAVVDHSLPTATLELLRLQMVSLRSGGGLRQHRFGFKSDANAKPQLYTKPHIFEAELDDSAVGQIAPELAPALQEIDLQSAARKAFPWLNLTSGEGTSTVKLQSNEGGGCFPHHYDNAGPPSKRKLTALFYLNPNWKPADGGELLISPWLAPCVRVPPVHGRLALFLSDTMLHRVLPCHSQRYCFTIWLDGLDTNSEEAQRLDARKPCGPNLRLDPAQRLLSRAVYAEEYASSIEECFAQTPAQMAEVLKSHHAHVNAQMANPAFARLVATAKTLKAEHTGAEVLVSPPTAPTLEPPRQSIPGAVRSPRQTQLDASIHICAKGSGLLGARIKVRPVEASAATARAAVAVPPPTSQRQCPADIFVEQDGHLGARATGGWVWEASKVVERVLLDEAISWEGLRVTELGAGTGRLALRLASLGAFVTATDRKAMLGLMKRNVALNQRRLLSPSSRTASLEVRVQELDWEDPSAQLPPADLVIGADVIYDERFHPALISVLARYASEGVRCILGWEERKVEPEATFLRKCSSVGRLRCRELGSHVLTSQMTTVDNQYALGGERKFVVYEMLRY